MTRMILGLRQKLVPVAAAGILLLTVCWLTSQFGTNSFRVESGTKISASTIPKILHQTWDTENVPRTFMVWMSSWLRLHPQWEYYFWTEADVRHLIVKDYPDFVSMYDGYQGSLFRSDAMRYFVLYKYGGVYADLDVEALRPMDDLLAQYDCFFSYETYEHALFVYHKEVPYVMTTVMATKPAHPFFKKLINSLKVSSLKSDVMDATGPFFLDKMYLEYSNESNNHPVTILPSVYLLPTFDRGQMLPIKLACDNPQTGDTKKLCDWHKATHWRNNPGPESYTNHHWFHVIFKDETWKHTNTFHIDTLVPNRTRVRQITQRPTTPPARFGNG